MLSNIAVQDEGT